MTTTGHGVINSSLNKGLWLEYGLSYVQPILKSSVWYNVDGSVSFRVLSHLIPDEIRTLCSPIRCYLESSAGVVEVCRCCGRHIHFECTCHSKTVKWTLDAETAMGQEDSPTNILGLFRKRSSPFPVILTFDHFTSTWSTTHLRFNIAEDIVQIIVLQGMYPIDPLNLWKR